MEIVIEGPVITDPDMDTFGTSHAPGHVAGAYIDLLRSFLRQGYRAVAFNKFDPNQEGQLLLRHDVDFDTNAAVDMAEMEASLGVRSTYFFLLSSRMYNLLNPADAANVRAIRDMGHDVSLHFDATVHADIREGLAHELRIFEACFTRKVNIISFHRPEMEVVMGLDRERLGVANTYEPRFFRDIKYMSDSTGAWRYGHPCNTDDFAQCRNVQLLIHPIWWTITGTDSIAKLESYLALHVSGLRLEVARNCVPFRQIVATIEVA